MCTSIACSGDNDKPLLVSQGRSVPFGSPWGPRRRQVSDGRASPSEAHDEHYYYPNQPRVQTGTCGLLPGGTKLKGPPHARQATVRRSPFGRRIMRSDFGPLGGPSAQRSGAPRLSGTEASPLDQTITSDTLSRMVVSESCVAPPARTGKVIARGQPRHSE